MSDDHSWTDLLFARPHLNDMLHQNQSAVLGASLTQNSRKLSKRPIRTCTRNNYFRVDAGDHRSTAKDQSSGSMSRLISCPLRPGLQYLGLRPSAPANLRC